MLDTYTIERLSRSVQHLAEAQERLRVAGRADERIECMLIIGRLLTQLKRETESIVTMVKTRKPDGQGGESVVYAVNDQGILCVCNHLNLVHRIHRGRLGGCEVPECKCVEFAQQLEMFLER
jgi:hypothetical protein